LQFRIRGCHPLWPDFPDRSPIAFLSLVTLDEAASGLLADRRSAPPNVCGPATPRSPCGSHGLGSSDFARHYFRNHGCFLFLQVLRWFTSLGSLHHPIYSDDGNQSSFWLGSPIRTSPDHRLLASPRGFSQLATSFFAYLRQGIHTHALSSLTIKLTPLHRVRLISYSCFASAPLLIPTSADSNLLLCTASNEDHRGTVPVRYSIVKDQYFKLDGGPG
jgi:hypothetical protein